MGEPEIVVIGAGPAGLFCAIHIAARGCRVLVLEKNANPGAKLLLAGSGQCNLTHEGEVRDFFIHYGDHGKFMKPALHALTNRRLKKNYLNPISRTTMVHPKRITKKVINCLTNLGSISPPFLKAGDSPCCMN